MMGALHNKWKDKGYKDPEPPDYSSSLKEWENVKSMKLIKYVFGCGRIYDIICTCKM